MKLELGNNKQTNLIIQYLLDTSKTDEHLRLAIEKNPDKDFENGCFNYIINQASKFQTNRCAMIEDKQVFDWAFEYYIDYEQIKAKEQEAKTPKISNSSVSVKTSEADTKKAVKSENKADKKAKKRIEDNKKYIERVHNLIDKDFGNEKYSIQIIPSVKDFYYEGKINFKNCCYSMEYFKKESSLVFIVYIRENMKRCEMAELQLNNKKQLVINQCYGACNKHTENHDEIMSLLAQQSKMIKQTYLRG